MSVESSGIIFFINSLINCILCDEQVRKDFDWTLMLYWNGNIYKVMCFLGEAFWIKVLYIQLELADM